MCTWGNLLSTLVGVFQGPGLLIFFYFEHEVLAQRPITLVLMMINSCSYSTNDLVFIKFQIFIKILVGV